MVELMGFCLMLFIFFGNDELSRGAGGQTLWEGGGRNYLRRKFF